MTTGHTDLGDVAGQAGAPAATEPAGAFQGVVGQPGPVAILRAAARRPVHAYLLYGPSGSGARRAAIAFAAALLCPDAGCGECAECRRALAGTHPDLVVMERTGAALGVEEARQLVALAQRRPYESSRQVLVVTDVHLAVRSAPTLLKTLEEPPSSTVFVLVADDVPPELATVASRCVEVQFAPVPVADVAAWLVERGVAPERARAVAEGCGGDIDRAELLVDDAEFGTRLALWRSLPGRLDGTGAAAATAVQEVLDAVERALGPLRQRQAEELERYAEELKSTGERGGAGRREMVERHRREERRWRTDEIRAGLGVLAQAYRDRLADAVTSARPARASAEARAGEARAAAVAVDALSAAGASLQRNPNETLLLESLFAGLGKLGA